MQFVGAFVLVLIVVALGKYIFFGGEEAAPRPSQVVVTAPQARDPSTGAGGDGAEILDGGDGGGDAGLTLADGEPFASPGRTVVSLAAGDAAVIQAYEIDGARMCQVAGAIGPAEVAVTDGEGWIFRGVNAARADLAAAMDRAAQIQQAHPAANCGRSLRFFID